MTSVGGSSPAASSIAGQYTQWNRRMSLPMTWWRGPPGVEAVGVGAEADGGQVVDQSVEPDVGDVRGVPRDRDAPGDRGAADREVLEPAPDEPEGLVALALGPDEVGVGVVPVEQRLLEPRELEEVVVLLDVLDRPVVDRAQRAVDQLVDRVVGLARHAVQALVGPELM